MSCVRLESWGEVDGESVKLITLSSSSGMQVKVCSLGCAITQVRMPSGKDVILGYDSLDKYVNGKANFGTVVGRYANRIAGAKFELDGKVFQLSANNGPNALHGGPTGFFKRVFRVVEERNNAVVLEYVSKDMEEGYPGNLTVRVMYRLDACDLLMEMTAKTDKRTVVNLCNHAYWNLNGHQSGQIHDHVLALNASTYTPVNADLIITGEVKPVEDALDFSGPKPLGEALKTCSLDHNFVINKGCDESVKVCDSEGQDVDLVFAADLKGGAADTTCTSMRIYTNQPGIQVYTGNFINNADPVWSSDKENTVYDKHGAVCLETQNWPDAVNHENFPSPILEPGSTYKHYSLHRFT